MQSSRYKVITVMESFQYSKALDTGPNAQADNLVHAPHFLIDTLISLSLYLDS